MNLPFVTQITLALHEYYYLCELLMVEVYTLFRFFFNYFVITHTSNVYWYVFGSCPRKPFAHVHVDQDIKARQVYSKYHTRDGKKLTISQIRYVYY